MLSTRALLVVLLLLPALPVLAEDPPVPEVPEAEVPEAPEVPAGPEAPEAPASPRAPAAEPPAPPPAPPETPAAQERRDAGAARADNGAEPDAGTLPPASWEPLEDGPPPPTFPPRSAPDLETPIPARRGVDPFSDEPGLLPDGEDDLTAPGEGMVGGALPLPAEPPTRTEVVGIRKTHNVTWRCECPYKALRLDVLFAVVGHRGDYVGAAVDFYDASGRPLLSVLEPFINRSGQVSAWTKLIRIEEDARWLRTTLMVPYRAFPGPADRGSYVVEARVRLVQRRGPDQYRALATSSTTFTVHGTDDAPRDWRDYTGADPAPIPSCEERVRRFLGRRDVLNVVEDAPRRARTKWRPFCPVPGA